MTINLAGNRVWTLWVARSSKCPGMESSMLMIVTGRNEKGMAVELRLWSHMGRSGHGWVIPKERMYFMESAERVFNGTAVLWIGDVPTPEQAMRALGI